MSKQSAPKESGSEIETCSQCTIYIDQKTLDAPLLRGFFGLKKRHSGKVGKETH
jgi:hypothetical protein